MAPPQAPLACVNGFVPPFVFALESHAWLSRANLHSPVSESNPYPPTGTLQEMLMSFPLRDQDYMFRVRY